MCAVPRSSYLLRSLPGPDANSGHYRVVLSLAGDRWLIKDDNSTAVACTYEAAHTAAAQQGYVLLYERLDSP